MKKILYLAVLVMLWGCNGGPETEKLQSRRDHIVHVREKVTEISMEDVLIGSIAPLYIIHDYLIISDHRSNNEQIHIFDRNNFNHITSMANKGQGPGEIANLGHIEAGENRRFYVTDHGKQKIFDYHMDSVLTNPLYMPDVKMTLDAAFFPSRYQYINDTLAMGAIIKPVKSTAFNQSVAKINFSTGEIKPMPYNHPDIERKRVCLAVSAEHDIYVEGYHHHDLMTICNLNGDLKYNIYGGKWDDRTTNKYGYYGQAVFCNDKIVASFSEGKDQDPNSSGDRHPTQFLVFNTNGDYIRTLETGYPILNFCYDKKNNRIIMSLDAEIQFAYLNLNGLTERRLTPHF
ncbi:MAG: 6-bladed beta-propeller [Prevotellaceae bacterium]|nr:6-bladed beta-propeller [Prevotellaceae bacterium]